MARVQDAGARTLVTFDEQEESEEEEHHHCGSDGEPHAHADEEPQQHEEDDAQNEGQYRHNDKRVQRCLEVAEPLPKGLRRGAGEGLEAQALEGLRGHVAEGADDVGRDGEGAVVAARCGLLDVDAWKRHTQRGVVGADGRWKGGESERAGEHVLQGHNIAVARSRIEDSLPMLVEHAVLRRHIRVASAARVAQGRLALRQAHGVEVLRDLRPELVGAEGLAVRATRAEQLLRFRRVRQLRHALGDRVGDGAGAGEVSAEVVRAVALCARAAATIAEVLVLRRLRRKELHHDVGGLARADCLLHDHIDERPHIHGVRHLGLILQICAVIPIRRDTTISALVVSRLVQFILVPVCESSDRYNDEDDLRCSENRKAEDVSATSVLCRTVRQVVFAPLLELVVGLVLVAAHA
mmetsp:Transcript_63295/g.177100  ORF Transcript_63295/g.177100 Transcript_63295/m.177100 type:complete len:409 (-) Transcript_63295:118-1344(-)